MTRYAFFDLDYTLTRQGTGILFLLYTIRRKPLVLLRMMAGFLMIPLWKLGILQLQRLKEFFFGFLKGMEEEELRNMGNAFLDHIWEKAMKPEAIAELEKLKSNGFIPVLASASPHFYVTLIADRLGIRHAAGTKFELENGRINGRMSGRDCRGPDKIPRIAELVDLKDYDWENSMAFSDSDVDIPLLGLAGKAFKVAKHEWQLKPYEP